MPNPDGLPSLEDMIQRAGGPVAMLRNNPMGAFVPPGYPLEFTTWRDEQLSWMNSVALLEQSYHISELHLRGPGVIPFLKEIVVNKLDPFPVMRGKQLVAAAPDGSHITDAVMFREEEDFVRIAGDNDWIRYHAERSSHDITFESDLNWFAHQGPRSVFRIQLQGPHALALTTEVAAGTLPDISFFGIGELTIAGKTVRALRHGMAGTPGFEIYGAWDDQFAVREAIEEAGQKYGLRKVGALAYPTSAQESAWMPVPLPGIFAAPELREYREWLGPYSIPALGSLAGSMTSDRIEDYYVDPIELGYGGLIDWNRDFIGRDALKEKAANPRRAKVTLVWNDRDVSDTISASLFDPEHRAQFFHLPAPSYGTFPADAVRRADELVGVSQWATYSANAGHVISNAMVDLADAKPGTELTLLWGNPDLPSPYSDAQEVREIRVTVAPAPYFAKVIKASGAQPGAVS